LSEKLAGAADEREALCVFIGARTLADKDKLGFGIAVGEDDVFASLMELATFAVAKVFADFEERVVGDSVHRVEE